MAFDSFLSFYVCFREVFRTMLSDVYKNYGVEVKSTDASAKTARKLLEDGKLDYLYLLKGETMGGIADGRIFTVPLCLSDRIEFELSKVL